MDGKGRGMSQGNETATVARVAGFLRSGELARAERTGRAVLKREPRNPDAWHLHAMAALEAGNLAKARSRLERAIAIRADNSVFHSNLGAVLERLGDLEGSYRAHDRALALDRGPADNWFNHGLILLRLGRPAEAASSLRAARDRAAGDPEIRLNLGRALERTGDGEGALGEYRSALARAAGSGGERWAGEIKGALRRILGVVFPVEAPPDVRRFLVEAGVAPDLGPAAAAQLRIGAPSPQDETAVARFLAEKSGDRLFLDYLRGGVNLDPELERLLAAGRAHRLREWTAAGEVEAVARAAGPEGRLAAALAIQCFHNEYAWYVSEEEKALLAAPAARLDRALAGDGPIDPLPDPRPDAKSLTADLLLVSLYRPANALAGAQRLAAVARHEWNPPVAELVLHSLHGPREELGIARGLPALAAVRDRISRAVQAQYEENPYPRWISLPPGPDLDLGETLARRFPDRPVRGPVETVLVAGGGTGYEPLLAARQNSRAAGALARSQPCEPRLRRAHGPPARDGQPAFRAGRSARRRDARRALRRRPRERGCCITWRTRRPGCGCSPGCCARVASSRSAFTASTPGTSWRRPATRRREAAGTARRKGFGRSAGRSSKAAGRSCGASCIAPISTP